MNQYKIKFLTKNQLTDEILERANREEIDVMSGFLTSDGCYAMMIEPPVGKNKLYSIQMKWIDEGMMSCEKESLYRSSEFKRVAIDIIQ